MLVVVPVRVGKSRVLSSQKRLAERRNRDQAVWAWISGYGLLVCTVTSAVLVGAGAMYAQDKEFCDSRCRQNQHCHHRIKGSF